MVATKGTKFTKVKAYRIFLGKKQEWEFFGDAFLFCNYHFFSGGFFAICQ